MLTLTLIAATMRRLASLPVRAVKFARDRQALAHLAMLDDRMLRDIGLERSDVYDAMALPFGQDASEFLQDRRGGRPGRSARLATEIASLSAGTFTAPASRTEMARIAA